MDQQKLRTLVFEKTGIKVDTHDPIFALVALNEAVLAESVDVHIAAMEDATQRLSAQIKQLQENGGVPRHEQVLPFVSAALASPGASPAASTKEVAASGSLWLPMAVGAVIALASAALALAGQALLAKPPTVLVAPASRPFSAEQTAMLRNAEKMNKALQNLDPETRARLQAEMQKQ